MARIIDALAFLIAPLGLFLLVSELQQQKTSWLALTGASLMLLAGAMTWWRDLVRPWLDRRAGRD